MAAFAGALTAAIPVIDKIVQEIFPGSKNNDKKTKAEANAAVAGEKSASSTALKSVSDELSLISTLLEFCLPAEDGVVMMQAVLEANKGEDLSTADKLTIRKSWSMVTNNLAKISDKDTRAAVRKLSDVYTRSTFLDVIDANIQGIGQDIVVNETWALEPLSADVIKLFDLLNKVNKIAGQVVGGISAELEKLAGSQKSTTEHS